MNQELVQVILSIFSATADSHNSLCGHLNDVAQLYKCEGVACSNCCLSKSGYPHGDHYLKPFITFHLREV